MKNCRVWTLIVDPALDGASNMAIDAALLGEAERSAEPRTTLRLYSWARPTVSLGRNQKVFRAVDVDYCREEGIGVVHRPTGGRAVLHDDELTYAVVSNDAELFGGSVYGTYRRISEALLRGYRSIGVDAALAPDTHRRGRNQLHDDPCFVSASRYELMHGGRKIAGSAQRRLRTSFLQHGSMPLTCDRARLARATRVGDRATLEKEMAGIAECIGERPTMDALAAAFRDAFAETFGVAFSRPATSAAPHGPRTYQSAR